MIDNRNVNIIIDVDGNKIALINDIIFKNKQNIDWKSVEEYLKGYIGDFYEISESAEKIYIGSKLSEEYAGSESRKKLRGGNAKAKANAATAIPELIQIATNPTWQDNHKDKHKKDAKYGWYRYEIRFAIPVYDNEILTYYSIYKANLLVNHSENGKKYLYDMLGIKKETSKPQQ